MNHIQHFEDLKLRDLKLISELPHHKSLRELSRHLKIEPQNLSKIIKRIEDVCGQPLLIRNHTGYVTTPEAEDIIKRACQIVPLFDEKKEKNLIEYTICSRVFTNLCFAPLLSKTGWDQKLVKFVGSCMPELVTRFYKWATPYKMAPTK